MMTERMTYADLVQYVADLTLTSRSDVLALTRNLIQVIKLGLDRDGRISVPGLGRFELKWHAARQGRNPRTGEIIQIPGRQRVHFKPEAHLREFLNRKYANQKSKAITGRKATLPLPVQAVEPAQNEEIPEYPDPARKKEDKLSRWIWAIPVIAVLILIFFLLPKTTDNPSPRINRPVTTITADMPSVEKPEPIIPTKAKPPASGPAAEHKIQRGDRLWGISEKFYQNVYLWPNIYRANLNAIPNPDILVSGIMLHIPAFEGAIGQLTDKDKKQIAIGYIHAYLSYQRMGKSDAYAYLWAAKQAGGKNILDPFIKGIDSNDLQRADRIKGKLQF